MNENQKDTVRALTACQVMLDGRDPHTSAFLLTLEHAVATALLLTCDRDPARAAAMLNEGLVPGVESRLAMYNSVQKPAS